MKRILFLITLVILAVSLLAGSVCAENGGKQMNKDRYGLHVEADGTVTLRGKPFYGFGVNYFAAFARYVESDSQVTEEFEAGLAGLASYNIPFIRMPLSGYSASYYDLYDEDPERVFSYMKAVLDECEKNHIGVIGSLMWWEAAIPCHIKGKRSDMGDPESETVKYAKKYVADVVSRFADHPAIWGWEIGNEYNLNADLCDKELKEYLWYPYDSMPVDDIDGFDYYTSEEMAAFYSEIAGVIREYDTYRIISTGNGEMRPASYALYEQGKEKDENHLWDMRWDANTREQFEYTNKLMTPDPVDTLCFHLQQATYDGSNRYIMNFRVFGRNLSSKEYFQAYYETAKSMGKACYFGEFGDLLDMENAPDMEEKFREITNAISESGIQIASLWQFQDYTDEGPAGIKLTVLSEMNRKLSADGKQGSDSVWQPPTGDEPVYEPEITNAPKPTDDPEESHTSLRRKIVCAITGALVLVVAATVILCVVFGIKKAKKVKSKS
ncbi:MAG: cellulase family glycosylhydrolase [Clostridia bacterium]|nr:cellulase family glycosylhydrolase [Clostridia bacterium]